MNRLDLKPFASHRVISVLLALAFVPIGLRFVVGSLLPHGFLPVPFFIGLACLSVYALILWGSLGGRGQTLKSLSDEGALRHDGRLFPWSELDHVLYRIRYTRTARQDLEWMKILFKNGGTVFVQIRSAANFREVIRYIEALPCPKKQLLADNTIVDRLTP